ncbi:zinc finger protein 100-like isoform X1 [Micropterus dolomieu]|uniref:zinc finger protein 100-like isoform X1 n=1 Tax=Micropterus dolomieu TaxID=147949 RepID=UPI001E8DD6CA|nr:zinc finger protein 100-like isoform X1 [Micropterus dolomieu]
MSSFECLREFVNERLSAAAEEIFGVFKKTIIEYEEEIDRQRRLLVAACRPIQILRIELPQQHVCKEEEEVLADQQLCVQERNCSLDQEEPEPPQIKEDHREPEPSRDHQLLSHNIHVSESQDQTGGKHEDSGSTRVAESEPQRERPHKSESYSNNVYNSLRSDFNSNAHIRKTLFPCDTCGKTFHWKSCFKIHLRSHTGEKPYTCKTCGSAFSRSDQLTVHMKKVHKGEKPYLCKTCGQTFITIYQLKKA